MPGGVIAWPSPLPGRPRSTPADSISPEARLHRPCDVRRCHADAMGAGPSVTDPDNCRPSTLDTESGPAGGSSVPVTPNGSRYVASNVPPRVLQSTPTGPSAVSTDALTRSIPATGRGASSTCR